jgi:signal peptidase I
MKMNEKVKKVIKEIFSIIIVIVIGILIKIYIFCPVKVQGTSMYPTLHDKDYMIMNAIGYYLNGLERFDIVVVKTDNDMIIKRVIGLPGETIEYKDNALYVNGEEIEEEFTHDITHNFKLSEINVEVIPEGYYFVVGDNRGNSSDSRTIGLISKNQIKGKARFIVFPFSRMGNVK